MTNAGKCLKMMNDIAKHKSKTAAKHFKIEVLTDIIQAPPEWATKDDIMLFQEELDKLKQDYIPNPPPTKLDFCFAILDALAKQTNDDPKKLIVKFLDGIIKKPGGFTPEEVKKIEKILDESQNKQ